MPTTHEAVVKVLTAEVRVLMVGSRQVTLSVFRQLDIKPYKDIMPKGRVNEKHEQWVIGKDATGHLVRGRHTESPDGLDGREVGRIDEYRDRVAHPRKRRSLTPEEKRDHERLEVVLEKYPQWLSSWQESLRRFEALELVVLAGLR